MTPDPNAMRTKRLSRNKCDELARQATRLTHIERRFDKPPIQVWMLTDGRTFYRTSFRGRGGAGLLFESTSELVEWLDQPEPGPSHLLAGVFTERDLSLNVQLGIDAFLKRFGLHPASDLGDDQFTRAVLRKITRLRERLPDDVDLMHDFILFFGESVRVRTGGAWFTRPTVYPDVIEPMIRLPDGTVVNPWLGVFKNLDEGPLYAQSAFDILLAGARNPRGTKMEIH